MSDNLARVRAVTDYETNLLVVAGAGTGKTSLLVERILNQLIEQELATSAIAAITFTEKAAAEMRTRIEAGLERLVKLAREKTDAAVLDLRAEPDRSYRHLVSRLPASEIERKAKRAFAELPRAGINTIHGFCASILRTFPIEARVDPDFSVDDGLQLRTLAEELWQRFLGGADGPGGAKRTSWQSVLGTLDLQELREIALRLIERPGPDLGYGPFGDACELLAAPTRRVLAELEPFVTDPEQVESAPRRYLAAAKLVLETLISDGPVLSQKTLEITRYRDGRQQERGLLEGSSPTAKHDKQAEACAKQVQAYLKQAAHIDDRLLLAALELILPFVREVDSEAQRRGVLSFDSLLALTRNLLAANSSVRRRLAEQIRLLCVDEFQDTDPLQYEIVFYLAEDAASRELEPGKLFIVGDPKQSIYRFRGADISAYHQAAARLLAAGAVPLELTKSWRAVPELVAPLDPLFAALLRPQSPEDTDIEPDYTLLEAGRPSCGNEPRVELWTVGPLGQERRVDAARSAEGEVIASWIERECTAGRWQPADVAILLRALVPVYYYTRALRNRGVPLLVEGNRRLQECPEALELRALFRALANPNDAPAVLGVLRSPLGAVPDRELFWYSKSDGADWCYLAGAPDPEHFPNLARSFEFLEHWWSRSLELPTETWLQALMAESPLLALQAAATDGESRLLHVRPFLDRLVELARRNPGCTLDTLLPQLEQAERWKRLDTETNAVRILSVHAAKGLEFPVVFLADLGRGIRDGDPRSEGSNKVRWLPQRDALAIATAAVTSSSWLRHELDEDRHLDAESKRRFYVACTRAREKLILVNAPRVKKPTRPVLGYLAPWNYQESVASELCNGQVAHRIVEPEAAASLAPPAAAAGLETKIVPRARVQVAPLFQSPSELTDADRKSAERAPEIARLVGLVMHDLLERWDFHDADEARALLEPAIQRAARSSEIDLDRLRQQAIELLEAFLATELPGYLASVEILARELPLLYEHEGTSWNAKLDLLYRDAEGSLVIGDYKSDPHPDQTTNERYREQLEAYGCGIAYAFQTEPALELLYLASGERVRLSR